MTLEIKFIKKMNLMIKIFYLKSDICLVFRTIEDKLKIKIINFFNQQINYHLQFEIKTNSKKYKFEINELKNNVFSVKLNIIFIFMNF